MQLAAAVAALLLPVLRRNCFLGQKTTNGAGRYRIVLAAGYWRGSLTRPGFLG